VVIVIAVELEFDLPNGNDAFMKLERDDEFEVAGAAVAAAGDEVVFGLSENRKELEVD
jgi:hypothetical protein